MDNSIYFSVAIFLLGLMIPGSLSQVNCPSGFEVIPEIGCFNLQSATVFRNAADSACQNQGGFLAEIDSAYEQEALLTFIEERNPYCT